MDYQTIENKCESTPFKCITLQGHGRKLYQAQFD